jgi:methylase of polypeptide subunit release factors
MPRMGSEAEFGRLREVFRQCGFTPEGVCGRLEIESMRDFVPQWRGRMTHTGAETALDVLILLLLDGEAVAEDAISRLLPQGAFESFQALGLVAPDTTRPGHWFAGCTVYPVRDLVLASDRITDTARASIPMEADLVYPAGIDNTSDFLAMLPETRCEALLDIGTGTGVAALDGARYSGHTWGTDIATRSIAFAEFNRRLNGIGNATLVEGDLYAPVDGLTFDRIVTHPPYVPARANTMIFRDGGEDGEQILRCIVEGVPRFLRTGGRFYTMVTAADCEDEPFEQRLRRWLGPANAEFDLVLAAHTLTTPRDLAANSFLGKHTAIEDIRFRHDLWSRRKVRFLFHGSVMMRRHGAGRSGYTVRVLRGAGYTKHHVEWLLAVAGMWRDPAARAGLMAMAPVLSPRAEMAVLHRVREGALAPEAFTLRAAGPFEAECVLEGWLAQIVARCDGATTWREHFETAKADGMLLPATPVEEFIGLLEPLVTNGLLCLSSCPLPEA